MYKCRERLLTLSNQIKENGMITSIEIIEHHSYGRLFYVQSDLINFHTSKSCFKVGDGLSKWTYGVKSSSGKKYYWEDIIERL